MSTSTLIRSASASRIAASSTRSTLPRRAPFHSTPRTANTLGAPPPPPGAQAPKPKSAHGMLYGSIFPSMVPVFLLGSAVYLGLQLTQMSLAHEKAMDAAHARVRVLEAEIDALQGNATSALSSASASTPPTTNPTSTPDAPASEPAKAKSKWW